MYRYMNTETYSLVTLTLTLTLERYDKALDYIGLGSQQSQQRRL